MTAALRCPIHVRHQSDEQLVHCQAVTALGGEKNDLLDRGDHSRQMGCSIIENSICVHDFRTVFMDRAPTAIHDPNMGTRRSIAERRGEVGRQN
ncbi:MAG: hypothetical protein M3406_13435 [Chloroflexota bacterium]|nr:hypothetical protein [Chloroflexota bacterium]